jgi:hypothetical protein
MLRHVVSVLLLFVIWTFLAFFLAFGVDPHGPMLLALVLGFAVAFLPLPSQKRTLKDAMIATVVYALFLGAILILRRAPFCRYSVAYHRLRPGMSLTEAESVVRRELPFRTTPIDGNLGDGWVRFEPANANYNADYIEVLMFHGRVAEIGGIPD